MKFKKPPIRAWIRQLFVWVKQLLAWVMRNAKLLLALAWLFMGVPYLMYELASTLSSSGEGMFGDVRAILLTLAAWIGAPFLVWRTLLADRQTQINRESHYTDLFAKAVESLGATRPGDNETSTPVTESRIGAIFALERLAKHSRSDYGTIVETLSAYIREQCGKPSVFEYDGENPDEEGIPIHEREVRVRAWCEALWAWLTKLGQSPAANRADVAVALKVISRRREGRHWKARGDEDVQPNLYGANLQGADLSSITEGLIAEDTGILHAHLEGASFSGFYLEGSTVVGPIVQHEIHGSRLVARQLVGVSLLGLTLRNADYFPILDGANLSFAHLDNANCNNGSFRGARLVRAFFTNAKVRNAKFGCANASDAEFDGADLDHAEFLGALLRDVSFVGANLSHSVFHGAFLRNAKFEGALLIGADFTGARELEVEMIERAFGTTDISLPSGIARPEYWTDDASAVEKWNRFRKERGLDTAVRT